MTRPVVNARRACCGEPSRTDFDVLSLQCAAMCGTPPLRGATLPWDIAVVMYGFLGPLGRGRRIGDLCAHCEQVIDTPSQVPS